MITMMMIIIVININIIIVAASRIISSNTLFTQIKNVDTNTNF